MFLSFCYVFFPVFNVFFGFSFVFLVFLYFPFILLRFLLSFQCFPRVFICFSWFFCALLSFCYVFFSVFSVFFGFVVFSSQFATNFAVFHVAASQISCVSSIFIQFSSCFSPSCYHVLQSCFFPFNWLYVGLISLFSVDFTAFWFHFASLLLGSG